MLFIRMFITFHSLISVICWLFSSCASWVLAESWLSLSICILSYCHIPYWGFPFAANLITTLARSLYQDAQTESFVFWLQGFAWAYRSLSCLLSAGMGIQRSALCGHWYRQLGSSALGLVPQLFMVCRICGILGYSLNLSLLHAASWSFLPNCMSFTLETMKNLATGQASSGKPFNKQTSHQNVRCWDRNLYLCILQFGIAAGGKCFNCSRCTCGISNHGRFLLALWPINSWASAAE